MDDFPELRRLPEELRSASLDVGAKLAARGFRSWVVGGAVRDQVLGRIPLDVDIATDATPDDVEACFGETVPLGKRFGTVLVIRGGLGIEVTTLRAESGYADARRPDLVEFGTSVEPYPGRWLPKTRVSPSHTGPKRSAINSDYHWCTKT